MRILDVANGMLALGRTEARVLIILETVKINFLIQDESRQYRFYNSSRPSVERRIEGIKSSLLRIDSGFITDVDESGLYINPAIFDNLSAAKQIFMHIIDAEIRSVSGGSWERQEKFHRGNFTDIFAIGKWQNISFKKGNSIYQQHILSEKQLEFISYFGQSIESYTPQYIGEIIDSINLPEELSLLERERLAVTAHYFLCSYDPQSFGMVPGEFVLQFLNGLQEAGKIKESIKRWYEDFIEGYSSEDVIVDEVEEEIAYNSERPWGSKVLEAQKVSRSPCTVSSPSF